MDPSEQSELIVGDQIILLDGRTVDVFRKSTTATLRFHVNHLSVEGKQKKDQFEITLGVDLFGRISNGTSFKVPLERQDEVLGFFKEANSRRTEQPSAR